LQFRRLVKHDPHDLADRQAGGEADQFRTFNQPRYLRAG
jgi:hypothetical protein